MNLVEVQGTLALAEPAASAWRELVDQVRAETGITLTISFPGGAWRSEAMVLDMWRAPAKYGATKGTARPRSLGGPGSVHENGLCVDVWNWARLGTERLDAYAARHGFRRTIAAEPWHYQHSGIAPAGAIQRDHLAEEEEEDTDMKLLYVTDSVDGNGVPGWALLNTRTGSVRTLRADDPKNQDRANSWARVWGNARSCTRQDLANAQAAILATRGGAA
jgi:hypothetical protein